MLIIDKIAYNNRLSHANPFIKFGVGFVFLMLAVLWNNIWVLGSIILGMNGLLLFAVKTNKKIYLKLLLIPGIFIVLSLAAILFYISPEEQGFLFKIRFLGFYVGFSRFTLMQAGYSFLRCFAAVSCVYFITLTTGFNQLILVFKKLRLPKEMIEIIVLVYRFIFIFLEEVEEIHVAQEMRFGYISLKTSYHSLGILVSTLFKRIMIRYQDMSIALDTKLFDGEFYI